MHAPVIQFATMCGGRRVTFHVLGSGPGIAVLFPYHVNHIALNWRVPLQRACLFVSQGYPSLAAGTGDAVQFRLDPPPVGAHNSTNAPSRRQSNGGLSDR
jgi:hypothetical protein